MSHPYKNELSWFDLSRLLALAFLTAGVFTFLGLTLPPLLQAPVSADASISKSEVAAQKTVSSRTRSTLSERTASIEVPKAGAPITASKTTDEELKRTQERNRRLEALVLVLRQRKLDKGEVISDAPKDVGIQLISDVKR